MQKKTETKLNEEQRRRNAAAKEFLSEELNRIIGDEMSKPLRKQNTKLIASCVDGLIVLAGKDPDEVNAKAEAAKRLFLEAHCGEQARKRTVPARTRIVRRIASVAAAAMLIANVGLGSTRAMGVLDFSLSDKTLNSLENKVPFEEDDKTYIKTDESATYLSYETLLRERGLDGILLPWDCNPEEITYSNYGEYEEILIFFADMPGASMTIETRPFDVGDKTLTRIGEYNVYMTEYFNEYTSENVYLSEWEDEGNYYCVSSPSYDEMISIVKNMKQIPAS